MYHSGEKPIMKKIKSLMIHVSSLLYTTCKAITLDGLDSIVILDFKHESRHINNCYVFYMLSNMGVVHVGLICSGWDPFGIKVEIPSSPWILVV
jgi:hypothetical protein